VGGRRRPSIVGPCVLKEEVMTSLKLKLLSSKAKVACAAVALVFSLASVSFVVVLFDAASKESEPPPATLKSEPASAVATRERPARPAPG
jgi:hypothetical protein